MSTNLNSIYSSFMNNTSSIQQSSTEINSKGMDSALFATQLENAKKTATYFNETKNYVPETVVTIKSMNAGYIQKYYQGWNKQTIDYLKFKLKHLFLNMLTMKKVQKMNLDMYNLKKSMY